MTRTVLLLLCVSGDGVLSVGDVQRDLLSRFRRSDAVGSLRSHEARTLRRHRRLHRMLGGRPVTDGRTLLRQTVLYDGHT